MTKVVGIGFKEVGKIYWFNPGNLNIKVGYMVVVETVRGLEIGKVVKDIEEIEDEKIEHELKNVIRIATEKDLITNLENAKRAQKSLDKIKEIISEHNLEMKTLDCEYTLDGSKLLIYYNAEGRVDFRELVKDLASEFKVRIELRQIGQREGAKLLGGIGPCGRELCCKRHLREFDLVTMKMAKDQGMALSSSKITGVCGKLMCCISYENEYYAEQKKKFPQVGAIVNIPSGTCCKVISVDYLRELVKVHNTDEDDLQEWKIDEIKRTKVTEIVEDDGDTSDEGIDS